MNVSTKVQTVWLAPPRTATRSTWKLLELYEFKPIGITPAKSPYTHNIGVPNGAEDYNLLVNFRNPYSLMVSTWYYDHTRNKTNIKELSFEQYVRDKCITRILSSTRRSIKDHFYSEACNVIKKTNKSYIVIKYESLVEDIKKIPFIDFNDTVIQSRYNEYILKNNFNESSTILGELKKDSSEKHITDWRYYYTEELANIVYDYKAEQFEVFGYNKDSWKNS